MPRVMILYEDSRAGGSKKNFGPHALVKQCLCDRLGVDPWTLPEGDLQANPRGGKEEVLKTCREDLADLVARRELVIAVYDSDHARELVPEVPPEACRRVLAEALKTGCDPAGKLSITLLERNVETVLDALRALEPSLATAEEWEKAIRHKKPMQRDEILARAAKPAPPSRMLRERLLQKVPSLAYLVDKLAAVFQPPSPLHEPAGHRAV
jgi:hypothetical protein